jgi:hypothetical protein
MAGIALPMAALMSSLPMSMMSAGNGTLGLVVRKCATHERQQRQHPEQRPA